MAEQTGFFSRWSRLKAAGNDQAAPASALQRVAIDQNPATPVEEAEGVRGLGDADMPDLGTLDGDSEYGAFLSEGVSEALRRKALRQLFHSEAFNLRDGLNEYDDDYSTFSPLGETVTRQMKQWAERALSSDKTRLEGEAGNESAVLENTPGGEQPAEQGVASSSPQGDEELSSYGPANH